MATMMAGTGSAGRRSAGKDKENVKVGKEKETATQKQATSSKKSAPVLEVDDDEVEEMTDVTQDDDGGPQLLKTLEVCLFIIYVEYIVFENFNDLVRLIRFREMELRQVISKNFKKEDFIPLNRLHMLQKKL